MPILHANGIDLYYELHGPETADVLVLSNGIFMSTASWKFQVDAISRHFRVLVYDCRGMWRSDHPAGPYSMEQHADDLAGLLDGLGIKAAHFGGISYGAEVSMMFALRHPQMVLSLILASTVSQLDPLLRHIAASWDAALSTCDAGTLFDVTLPYNFSEEYIRNNPALLEVSRKRFAEMDLQSATRLMDAFKQVNFTGKLTAIKAPCLVINAENDILKTRKYSEIIADAIPSAEFAVIPHAGHACCLEQPGIFNTLVLGFLLKHSMNAA